MISKQGGWIVSGRGQGNTAEDVAERWCMRDRGKARQSSLREGRTTKQRSLSHRAAGGSQAEPPPAPTPADRAFP